MAARYKLAHAQSGCRDVPFPGRACLLLCRTVCPLQVADARNDPPANPIAAPSASHDESTALGVMGLTCCIVGEGTGIRCSTVGGSTGSCR